MAEFSLWVSLAMLQRRSCSKDTMYTDKRKRFFNKQPSCEWSNVKNVLKVKQLAKQPPTLKTLM